MKKTKPVLLCFGLAALVLMLSACGDSAAGDGHYLDEEPDYQQITSLPETVEPDYQEITSLPETIEPDYQEITSLPETIGPDDDIHLPAERQVIVNGQPVPGAFLLDDYDGLPTHVMLMPVLAALGTGGINVDSGKVTLEGAAGSISFTTWSGDFNVNGQLITLAEESFEVDGTIYVPIAFFQEVYGMKRAVFYGGYVFIDNEAF